MPGYAMEASNNHHQHFSGFAQTAAEWYFKQLIFIDKHG